ncbi:MAG: hypothetical protein RAO92_03710 [Candidatus Euphemobacter frigidus]|nr:hypothetical protein [Candidatus Euphemobacter frigidus]MDP8275489.1 hypothetical protein [Candidatus Euphemobacter frigidus]
MRATNDNNMELPPAVWLGFPIVSLLIIWLSPLLGYPRWKGLMTGEYGFVESATFVILLPVIVLAGVLSARFLRFPVLPRRPALIMAAVMLFSCLAAFYFAGEEINWGQIWFGWKTPEEWAAINYQQETSLHNIEGMSILNNIPRLMMLIATIIGGIILPLLLLRWRRKPGVDRKIWYYLIPSWRIIPASLIAACISIPAKFFGKGSDENLIPADYTYSYMAFVANGGEMKEYGFALVMLLYILGIYLLVKAQTRERC